MEYATMGDSSTDTTFESSPMDDRLFAREMDYQICMSITEGLLQQKLLTDEEAHKAKILLLQKYRPPIGELLTEAG